MPWNPDIYNKFKSERFEPFYDLFNLIQVKPGMRVIDLGCGTGELRRKLADALPDSTVLGIDNSSEMLHRSTAFETDRVHFEFKSIEDQLVSNQKWDLVFSNAALQWVDNHDMLLPEIIGHLNPGGQIAFQIPAQHHNVSNQLLNLLADQPVYQAALQGWKRKTPVLNIDRYAELFFRLGGQSIIAYEKIYPLIVPDSNALFDWVSGTALLPYLERLEGETRQEFIDDYKTCLQQQYASSPVFYPFKRILLSALF